MHNELFPCYACTISGILVSQLIFLVDLFRGIVVFLEKIILVDGLSTGAVDEDANEIDGGVEHIFVVLDLVLLDEFKIEYF